MKNSTRITVLAIIITLAFTTNAFALFGFDKKEQTNQFTEEWFTTAAYNMQSAGFNVTFEKALTNMGLDVAEVIKEDIDFTPNGLGITCVSIEDTKRLREAIAYGILLKYLMKHPQHMINAMTEVAMIKHGAYNDASVKDATAVFDKSFRERFTLAMEATYSILPKGSMLMIQCARTPTGATTADYSLKYIGPDKDGSVTLNSDWWWDVVTLSGFQSSRAYLDDMVSKGFWK